MGGDSPGFSQREREEITHLARYHFSGGKVPRWLERADRKWGIAFNIFLTAVNRENGSLGIDPLAAMDYPAITYSVLVFIQSKFILHVKEENEKLRRRNARGRR